MSLSAGRVNCNIPLFLSFSLSISELTYIERLSPCIQSITLKKYCSCVCLPWDTAQQQSRVRQQIMSLSYDDGQKMHYSSHQMQHSMLYHICQAYIYHCFGLLHCSMFISLPFSYGNSSNSVSGHRFCLDVQNYTFLPKKAFFIPKDSPLKIYCFAFHLC